MSEDIESWELEPFPMAGRRCPLHALNRQQKADEEILAGTFCSDGVQIQDGASSGAVRLWQPHRPVPGFRPPADQRGWRAGAGETPRIPELCFFPMELHETARVEDLCGRDQRASPPP